MNKKTLLALLYAIFILIIGGIAIIPNFLNELGNNWVRSELLGITIFHVVFLGILGIFSYKNFGSSFWMQKYGMNFGIFCVILFYYFVSRSQESSFPILAGMMIVTLIYIVPILLILQFFVYIVNKIKK